MSADLIGRNGQPLAIEGLALPYNETIVFSGQPESFRPGAFSKQFKRGEWSAGVPVDLDHEDDWTICEADRVAVLDTDFGMFFRAILPDNDRGRYIASLARSGELAASILFDPVGTPDATGAIARSRLRAISAVTRPAYNTAAWCSDDLRVHAETEETRRRFQIADLAATARLYAPTKPPANERENANQRIDYYGFSRVVANGTLDEALAEMYALCGRPA